MPPETKQGELSNPAVRAQRRRVASPIRPGRLFLRAHRLLRRIAPSLHPTWTGLWLGALPPRALEALDTAFYDASVKYSGSDHNLRGLFAWEAEAVRSHFSAGSRVMVLGAGGGREVIALRREGFQADGWESHPNLVAAGREILRATGDCPCALRLGPRSRVPEEADTYDGVILGWTMYTLVAGRATRVELLRGARARLATGGPLLLSFHYRPLHCPRSRQVLRAASHVTHLLRRQPPDLGDDLSPNYVHRFTQDQIRTELEAGGFQFLRYEQMGPGPYGEGWAVGRAG